MKKNILVIEDDPDIQEYLDFLFKDRNLGLTFTSSGEEALEEIQKGSRFDLLLLDLVLPGMQGEEFLDKALEVFEHEPPVILTSVDGERAKRQASRKEVAGIFVKGNHGDELVKMTLDVLGSHQE